MKPSKLFSVNARSFIHGFFMAVLTPLIAGIMDTLNTGSIPTRELIYKYAYIGMASGLAYIIKKFFTNSEGKMLKNEPSNKLS